MLSSRNRFSAPMVTPEHPFPLGPFPRHIWIHSNTPQDGLDETCHEIWKRVQRLSEELESLALVSPLPPALCPEPVGTLCMDSTDPPSTNYWLDEPEGLESIYRAMIGNREREMKLRALCDAQLSAKSVLSSLLCSAKPPRNAGGAEDGTGSGSTEGSKLDGPFLPKHTETGKGTGGQATAEEPRAAKEFLQNSIFSAAKGSLAVSSTAEGQTTGQKQQLPAFPEVCCRSDADTVTKALQNPATTATPDKKSIKYSASTSGFPTSSMSPALNPPAWQSLNFPPLPIFPNHSNFPQFQGPYQQRARMPYQQALHPSFGCYSRQVAPYNPHHIFQAPYTPMLNYVALVQPGYPYQQMNPPALPSSIQDLPPPASAGIQYPFSPSYGFSSTPGGAVTNNLNYFSSKNYVKY
ncbi:uncharacterized protein C1orf94 homolog [Columba livia]|uniref:uncharacterized protein C1orf94 homolog n=1 Tax=Columba livia TaxID=8932 RepID=UPI000A3AFED2|nr:uncharacterized protein C1orf94 homolog [Columba livia]